jgi:riboflavin biosynthesis pyrimidine reductase
VGASRDLRRGLSTAITDLNAGGDEGALLVRGGPDFAQSLTRLGLSDEYQLSTAPIPIGAGHSPIPSSMST